MRYTVEVKYAPLLERYRTILSIGVLLGLIGLALIIFANRSFPDIIVKRTSTGFVPSKITIHKGQAVVFISATGKEFWPASDFHPTHGVYPAFDPKRPLKADESWRFVFDRAGVWNFHDHLSERTTGTIIVLGKPGETLQTCLSHAATSSPDDLAECWSVDITETLESKGLSAAFDMFALLYAQNPSFRGLSCHDAGHILGASAYTEYEDNHHAIDRPETSYCGYGFYHGFIETMLRDQGPAQYAKVRAYCSALKTNGQLNNPSGACFHGIGHAALDSLPGELWGNEAKMVSAAIDVCEQALEELPERAQCSTGVYNALAVAESAHSYKLAFSHDDPMKLCRAQKEEYRIGCYKEFGIGVIRENKFSRLETISFIRSFKNPEAEAATLLGYVGDEVARANGSPDLTAFRTFCNSFSSTRDQFACERGVLSGLRQAGIPGKEYEMMFTYCALYAAGSARTGCYLYTVQQTRDITTDKAALLNACLASKEADIAPLCR